MKALLTRLQATHAWRTWQRYGNARGAVLAGGVTYLGFFSMVPALVLGFTVFGFVLRNQPDLFDRVVASISQTLPGMVKPDANSEGIIDASNPPTPNALTITGAISLVTMVLGGLGWLDALREGVRAIFGLPTLQINPVKGKLRDLWLLATLGLAVLASGLLSTVVNAAGPFLLRLVHIGDGSRTGTVLLSAAAIAVVFVVDLAIMLVVLRLLSGIKLPRRDLMHGAVFGAVGLGVLKLTSGILLKSAANKPLLASFAVIIGLLLLINLISRVMLLAAAWAATTAEGRGHLATGEATTGDAPLAGDRRTPVGPREAALPSFGQRASDRTTLAAGVVLGVSAAAGARTVRHGLRAAVAAVRGR